MSQKKIQLSDKMFNQVMQSPTVQNRLRDKAARLLPRAKAIALSDGKAEFAKALEVTPGIRPGTKSPTGLQRSYARIGAVITPDMKKDGYGKLTRQQVLRRASDG